MQGNIQISHENINYSTDFAQHTREYIYFVQHAKKYIDFAQHAKELTDFAQHERE